MKTLRTIGIRGLKDNLSALLREVQSGAYFLITDRDRVVAELHSPTQGYRITGAPENPLVRMWIENGILEPARNKVSELGPPPICLKPGLAQKLIDEDRGD